MLDTASTLWNLLTLEAIYIAKLRPSLKSRKEFRQLHVTLRFWNVFYVLTELMFPTHVLVWLSWLGQLHILFVFFLPVDNKIIETCCRNGFIWKETQLLLKLLGDTSNLLKRKFVQRMKSASQNQNMESLNKNWFVKNLNSIYEQNLLFRLSRTLEARINVIVRYPATKFWEKFAETENSYIHDETTNIFVWWKLDQT